MTHIKIIISNQVSDVATILFSIYLSNNINYLDADSSTGWQVSSIGCWLYEAGDLETVSDSRDYCISIGANLATATSKEDINDILSYATDSREFNICHIRNYNNYNNLTLQ